MNNQILLNLITEAKNHGLKGKSMIDNTDEKYDNKPHKKDISEEVIQEDKEDIDEVAEATSFSSEEVHGGNEATGDIEDSPNSKEDGESSKDELNVESGTGEDTSEEKRNTEDKEDNTNINNNESTKDEEETNTEDESVSSGAPIAGLSAMECLDSIKNAKDLSDPLYEAFLDVVKKIPSNNHVFGKQKYDIRKICNHMITYQEYKIPKDTYAKEVKTISIFVDTSGSMYYWGPSIKKAIKMIITAGYKVDLYACGNGFEYGESLHDDSYHTRKQLKSISPDANIPYIACPNEKDAINMCNASEVSIIVADFDGLSSIVRVAMGASKTPYLFSIEDRYSWRDPTEHDWVDPDFCEYPNSDQYVYNICEYKDDEDYDNDEDY